MNEPRVLLVNLQSVNKANATGITMCSFFRNWPEDRAMEISLEEKQAQMGSNDPLRMQGLTPAHNAARRWANGVFSKRVNSVMKQQSDTEARDTSKQTTLSRLRQAGVLFIDVCPAALSAKQWSVIDAFDPQVIYTLGASVAALQLAHRISVRYNVPIVLHFLDHWAEHLQWESNAWIRPYRKLLDRWLNKCMERTEQILTVSPPMAEAYEQRFHKPCCALMNAVDPAAFRCSPRQPDGTIRLVYAGGLHLNRWRALLEIGRALAQLPECLILDLYTDQSSQKYSDVFQGLPVVFHAAVPHEEIAMVYQSADILVHCESDDPRLKGFYKYSISTKIPEYLASGRLILYYGPKDTGVYDYLFQHNAAFLVASPDALLQTVREMRNAEQSKPVIEAALALAAQNHSREHAQAILKNALLSAILRQDVQKGAR